MSLWASCVLIKGKIRPVGKGKQSWQRAPGPTISSDIIFSVPQCPLFLRLVGELRSQEQLQTQASDRGHAQRPAWKASLPADPSVAINLWQKNPADLSDLGREEKGHLLFCDGRVRRPALAKTERTRMWPQCRVRPQLLRSVERLGTPGMGREYWFLKLDWEKREPIPTQRLVRKGYSCLY